MKGRKKASREQSPDDLPSVSDSEAIINEDDVQSDDQEVEELNHHQSDVDETSDKERLSEVGKEMSDNCGVIYLSRIPSRMNVKLVREYFQQFGDVGRVYLQPNAEKSSTKHSRFREFSEGWLEFSKRSVARKVALMLNNQQVGGRHRHPWKEDIWNIKYLKGFKWAHLNERMAYEKAVKAKRMRLEVGQAKKEAQFFADQLKFSKRLEKGTADDADPESAPKPKIPGQKRHWDYVQKEPEDDNAPNRQKNKAARSTAAAESKNFLANIFTAGKSC